MMRTWQIFQYNPDNKYQMVLSTPIFATVRYGSIPLEFVEELIVKGYTYTTQNYGAHKP